MELALSALDILETRTSFLTDSHVDILFNFAEFSICYQDLQLGAMKLLRNMVLSKDFRFSERAFKFCEDMFKTLEREDYNVSYGVCELYLALSQCCANGHFFTKEAEDVHEYFENCRELMVSAYKHLVGNTLVHRKDSASRRVQFFIEEEVWSPSYIEDMADILEAVTHPTYDVCERSIIDQFNVECIDRMLMDALHAVVRLSSPEYLFKMLRDKGKICPIPKSIRTELWDPLVYHIENLIRSKDEHDVLRACELAYENKIPELCEEATVKIEKWEVARRRMMQGKKTPDCFYCPITLCTMLDPVIATDGHAYERSSIHGVLTNDKKSPPTRKPLGMKLKRATQLKNQMLDFYDCVAETDRSKSQKRKRL